MPARLIKKYANRRLYDTQDSRYISTSDILSMLQSGSVLNIVDARSGQDITRSVLLSILAEAELDGRNPILSQHMLSKLLRYDDELLAGFLGNYLEQCLEVFVDNQEAMRACMQDFDGVSPYELIEQIQEAQQQVFNRVRENAE